MVKDEVGRAGARGKGESLGNRVNAGSTSGKRKGGVCFSKREENLSAAMGGGNGKEDVIDKGLVDGRAGRLGKWGEGTSGRCRSRQKSTAAALR